jgi:hypothetical protein
MTHRRTCGFTSNKWESSKKKISGPVEEPDFSVVWELNQNSPPSPPASTAIPTPTPQRDKADSP